MNELRNRGVEDIILAVDDGLKDFPDAITAVFPDAMVQTCIVHLLRGLDGLSLLEGPQQSDHHVQLRLPRHRRRRNRKGADGVRGGVLGPALSCHRPQLAARLGRGHPVLRLPRRGPQDRLYHQCHRGAELQAQACGPSEGPLPQRRCRHQAALSDLEPVGKRVEDAAT